MAIAGVTLMAGETPSTSAPAPRAAPSPHTAWAANPGGAPSSPQPSRTAIARPSPYAPRPDTRDRRSPPARPRRASGPVRQPRPSPDGRTAASRAAPSARDRETAETPAPDTHPADAPAEFARHPATGANSRAGVRPPRYPRAPDVTAASKFRSRILRRRSDQRPEMRRS